MTTREIETLNDLRLKGYQPSLLRWCSLSLRGRCVHIFIVILIFLTPKAVNIVANLYYRTPWVKRRSFVQTSVVWLGGTAIRIVLTERHITH